MKRAYQSKVKLNVTHNERHIYALYNECHYPECRYAECRGALPGHFCKAYTNAVCTLAKHLQQKCRDNSYTCLANATTNIIV